MVGNANLGKDIHGDLSGSNQTREKLEWKIEKCKKKKIRETTYEGIKSRIQQKLKGTENCYEGNEKGLVGSLRRRQSCTI